MLPEGFQRIRYYGFLANRYREQKLALCRELLDMPTQEPPAPEAANDYRQRYEELTGSSLSQCPVCHQGHMLVIAILPICIEQNTACVDGPSREAIGRFQVLCSQPIPFRLLISRPYKQAL